MIDIYETWQGWIVRQKINGTWQYIASVHNGKYTFTSDHLYARKYTERTAWKHARILNRRTNNETV